MREGINSVKQYLPGVALSAAVAGVAFLCARGIPLLGAPTIAILLGIVLGNTLFRSAIWAKGTTFCEKTILEISVVLLGFSVTLSALGAFGVGGVLFIVLQMAATIAGVLFLGKHFGFAREPSMLMAGGNAVCGSSAIAAIAPAIGASKEDKGNIITLVNLLGTVMMLLTPLLVFFVFPNNPLRQGALIGGVVQSVGQVVGGASMLGSDVTEKAMLFKILRILFLVVVVLLFSRMGGSAGREKEGGAGTAAKKGNVLKAVPWYVFGFILCCLLNSFLPFPPVVGQVAQTVSKWFEVAALAAIGLRLNLAAFAKQGGRFALFGLSVGALQIVVALVLVAMLVHV